MKCKKCGNEYPSKYYFATDDICKECFAKLPIEEKEALRDQIIVYNEENIYDKRVMFGKRFVATLIDVLFYAAINIAVLWYMGYFQATKMLGQEIEEAGGNSKLAQMAIKDFFASQKSTLILGQLIPLLYFSLELFIAASIGKLIMGMRIAKDDASQADIGTLTTRYLVKNLSGIVALIGLVAGLNFLLFPISPIIIFILLIGYFFILGKKRQGFHDMFSKTAVYMKEDLTYDN